MKQNLTIGVIGNPNCGKTTLFNACTGANLKVANWPGVTVEKVEGAVRWHNLNIRLVDLPGTYSLTSYTMEEQISRRFTLSDEADVILNVADALSLERSLYLTLQLLELGKPVVLALNRMDVVQKRGMEIDLNRLQERLGIPVIPVSARKRTGLDALLRAAAHYRDRPNDRHREYPEIYRDDIADRINWITDLLRSRYPDLSHYRWHAIKLLEHDGEIIRRYPIDTPGLPEHGMESEIINEKYDFIRQLMDEVLPHKERQDRLTERLDRVLTHRIWGIPIFLAVMAVVFFLTFSLGNWIKSYLESAVGLLSGWVGEGLSAIHTNEVLSSLIVDGVIGGVGAILTFLPNISILFLALALLEDSGYMARVAYVMEGIMSRLGLSGRAFIPMILGFGCTVPAIMASRVLASRRDQYKVMLITPFMSCSARLTVYTLFAGMFFAEQAVLAAYSMYLIGIAAAIAVAAVAHRMDRRKSPRYLLIELPEYRAPDARTVMICVWEKVKDYLVKAGTTIFIATLLIWLLLHLGPGGFPADPSDSFGAAIGRFLVPVFAPIGLGFWQIIVALIAGLSAKEVVVSCCAVLFGAAGSGAGEPSLSAALAAIGFGPLNAYCMMLFCLLYIPCVAALATIRRESGSWKWTAFSAAFQLMTAWGLSFAVYQIGRLIV